MERKGPLLMALAHFFCFNIAPQLNRSMIRGDCSAAIAGVPLPGFPLIFAGATLPDMSSRWFILV